MSGPEGSAISNGWRLGLAVALALTLPAGFAAAQQKTQLPEEKKGDPAPDTQNAANYLRAGRYVTPSGSRRSRWAATSATCRP